MYGVRVVVNKVKVSSVPFSPLTDWVAGGGGDMRDDSAEILFQSFLQETIAIAIVPA